MIEIILIIAFTVLFIHATTWPGHINSWVKDYTKAWPENLKKPVYDCPICMAPWWGSAMLLLLTTLGGYNISWYSWIIIVFSAGGINAVLLYIIKTGKAITKAMEEDNLQGSKNQPK